MTKRVSLVVAAVLAAGSFARAAAQAPPTPAASPRPAVPVARPKPTPAPPAFVEGVVLGPDAKPIAEAVVVVTTAPELGDPPVIVRTGADGAFRVPARRRGAHGVRVEARGLAAQTIAKALPGVPLRVTLAKGGAIDGVVRDAATGQPVAGAQVKAREESFSVGSQWDPTVGIVATETDAKGVFHVDGLARGRYSVSASMRGAGRASRSRVMPGQRVELLLVAGPTISGRVLTPDGAPVAGAAVRGEAEFGPGLSSLVGADAAGRFEIGGLPPGAYRVVAQHKDWAAGIAGGLRLERTGDVEVEVVLAPPVRVTGRLVDIEGEPLAGTVTLQEIDGQAVSRALAMLLRAEAGADGRFAIERIPPGSHALAVTGRGAAPRRVTLDVGARQKVVDLGDLTLEAGAQIRGHVRDKAGAPIPDAVLRGFADAPPRGGAPLEGRSEADGTFVLGGATASSYRLSAHAPGFAGLNRPVESPSDGVELVLDAAGSITGLVVDDAGRPVDAFDVTAQSSGGRDMFGMDPGRAAVSEGGRFTLDGVAPGTYTLEVSARDLGRQVVSGVVVAAGAVRDVGRIRLAAGGAVRGTVLDAAGHPIAGALVQAHGSDRPRIVMMDLEDTPTDAAGGFHLRGLATGTVVVSARHPDYAEGVSAPVEIEPARTAEASVVLTRGGRIEGVLRRRGAGGSPEALVTVRPTSRLTSHSFPTSVVPRADGTFTLDHVAPGRVGVALMTRSGMGSGMTSVSVKEIEVREGETAQVEFVWRDILLTGKVTRGGVPLPNVRLTARGVAGATTYMSGGTMGAIPAPTGGPQRMTAVTREDGSYEMIVGDPGRLAIRTDSMVGRKSYPVRMIEVADADAQTADFDFPTDGLSGVVVDGETEAPVANASVWASPVNPGPGGGHATTGPDGRFSLDVDPGQYRVRADADAYAATPDVEVTVGESPVADIRFALTRGSRLRGKVLDRQGRPAPGVWVMAQEAGDQRMDASATSAADGTFVFEDLRAATYSIAGGSGLSGFGMLTGVSPGGEDVVLRLSAGGRVRVTVRAVDGSPIAGTFANVDRVNGTRYPFMGTGGVTGPDGVVEIDAPAGTLEIEARKERLLGRGRVTVATGGQAAVDITAEVRPTP